MASLEKEKEEMPTPDGFMNEEGKRVVGEGKELDEDFGKQRVE